MAEWMSRDEFDGMTESEKTEYIRRGGQLYDGPNPPPPPRLVKKEYLISRHLYDSLSDSKKQSLNETYWVVIVD
jgi:hypothetical protein